MAKHDVKFTLPERPLGRADAEFAIKRDGEMLGKLKISNGTVVWVPKNKKLGFKLDWVKFSELMERHGQSEK